MFSGTLINKIPNGEGEFISEKNDIKFSYTGKWTDGKLSNAGKLETNNYIMHFSDVDRTGFYLGETESGVPSGQGKFVATNSAGSEYTYTGEFKNGLFNGQGSRLFDEKAEFINSNLQYIGANTFESSDIEPLVDKELSYADYVKQPNKYFKKIVCWEGYTI